MIRVRVLAPCLLAVGLAGGCSTGPRQMYDGLPQELNLVGVIHQGIKGMFEVSQVDGRRTAGWGFPEGLYVLPGPRVMHLIFQSPRFLQGRYITEDLTLNVEAGHTYVPRIQIQEDETARFWFDDKGMGYPLKCLKQDAYAQKYIEQKPMPECP